MSRSTFSGPISAGTVREGASSNLGNVVLSQSFDSGDLTDAEVGNLDAVALIVPAGCQIVDIVVDQVVAAGTGTTTVSVGTASGGAELMAGIATTAGGRFRGTATAATQLAWQIGTSDQTVYVRTAVGTDTLTAGRFILTVNYVQK
jgi:hypothetical protein